MIFVFNDRDIVDDWFNKLKVYILPVSNVRGSSN